MKNDTGSNVWLLEEEYVHVLKKSGIKSGSNYPKHYSFNLLWRWALWHCLWEFIHNPIKRRCLHRNSQSSLVCLSQETIIYTHTTSNEPLANTVLWRHPLAVWLVINRCWVTEFVLNAFPFECTFRLQHVYCFVEAIVNCSPLWRPEQGETTCWLRRKTPALVIFKALADKLHGIISARDWRRPYDCVDVRQSGPGVLHTTLPACIHKSVSGRKSHLDDCTL